MPKINTTEQRSYNMSRIRSKDTKPEKIVRTLLHGMGYRFRLNRKDVFGHPDIVLPKYKAVIFVHGCFWHRHIGCKYSTTPASNVDFWQKKFIANIQRDSIVQHELREQGWRVIVVWQCELKDVSALRMKLLEELPRS